MTTSAEPLATVFPTRRRPVAKAHVRSLRSPGLGRPSPSPGGWALLPAPIPAASVTHTAQGCGQLHGTKADVTVFPAMSPRPAPVSGVELLVAEVCKQL